MDRSTPARSHSHNPRSDLGQAARTGPVIALALAALAGCASPIKPQGQEELRMSVIEATKRELASPERWPEVRQTQRETSRDTLGIRPEFMPEVLQMAGPDSYTETEFVAGEDLLGQPVSIARVGIERVVRTAVANNLDSAFARLSPAISRAQVAEAEAVFDWTLFGDLEFRQIDQPRTQQSVGSNTFGVRSDRRDEQELTTGIRKRLESGATLTFQQDLMLSNNRTQGQSTDPDPANTAAWTLQLNQPLLRGFGAQASLAQIRLARNAEREQVARLRAQLIQTVTDTELAYWDLFVAYRDVLILQRNLERARQTLKEIEVRDFKTDSAQIASARADVQERIRRLTEARNTLSKTSDRLKLLINDDELTLGSDVLLLPADSPADEPIGLSLRDSLLTAFANRPELEQSVLGMDDASIRLRAANNARLPQLDLRLQTRFNGLDDDWGSAYGEVVDGEFVDFIAGLQFEYAIGNRGNEAVYQRTRQQQAQAAIAYRASAQDVTSDVLTAFRDVKTNYQLIEQAAASRLAATERLRVLAVEKKFTRENSISLLNEELRFQDALANAEREEIRAITDYNTAVARLFAATGTSLERNRVDLVMPGHNGR